MTIDFRDVFAAQSGEHRPSIQLSDKDKLRKGEQGSGGPGARGVGREVGGVGIERRGLWWVGMAERKYEETDPHTGGALQSKHVATMESSTTPPPPPPPAFKLLWTTDVHLCSRFKGRKQGQREQSRL